MTQSNRQALTVTQLNRQVRTLLETSLDRVWVCGEISNFSVPSSGHWYFTLKDDRAQVRCAMFRSANAHVRQRPANGDEVSVLAKVSLYEGRGEFQLVVERLEIGGEGVLQARFEALKARLGAEGLFDARRKRPIPQKIRHVGVITSDTGAAIHDILTVIRRRWPALRVTLIPAPVQGEHAAARIEAAIRCANARTDCDVLIVGRGGGSLEDLWPFNEERVARAIAASRIPVISAVGHEVDVTISDLVADERAPTPTAAAERVTPDRAVLERQLVQWEQRLHSAMTRYLVRRRQALEQLRERLRQPGDRLQELNLRVDDLSLRLAQAMRRNLTQKQTVVAMLERRLEAQAPRRRLMQQQERLASLQTRLVQAMPRRISVAHHRLETLTARLQRHHPEPRIAAGRDQVANLAHRMERAMQVRLRDAKTRFSNVVGALQMASPLNTLSRGYAIVTDAATGTVIRHAGDATPGSRVRARLATGHLICTVEESVLDEKVGSGSGDGLGPGLLPG